MNKLEIKFILVSLGASLLVLIIFNRFGYNLGIYFSMFFFGMAFMSFFYEFIFNKERRKDERRKTKNKTF